MVGYPQCVRNSARCWSYDDEQNWTQSRPPGVYSLQGRQALVTESLFYGIKGPEAILRAQTTRQCLSLQLGCFLEVWARPRGLFSPWASCFSSVKWGQSLSPPTSLVWQDEALDSSHSLSIFPSVRSAKKIIMPILLTSRMRLSESGPVLCLLC